MQFNTFKRLAQTNKKAVKFVHTHEKFIADQYQLKGQWAAVLLKNFDERRNDFKDNLLEEYVNEFLEKRIYPRIMPFDLLASNKIFEDGNPTLFVVHNGDYYSQQVLADLDKISSKIP